jgi:hypothetical protein
MSARISVALKYTTSPFAIPAVTQLCAMWVNTCGFALQRWRVADASATTGPEDFMEPKACKPADRNVDLCLAKQLPIGIVFRPVRHPVSLFRDIITAILVGFERHAGVRGRGARSPDRSGDAKSTGGARRQPFRASSSTLSWCCSRDLRRRAMPARCTSA